MALGKRDRLRVTSSSKHEICCVACTSGSHGRRLSCLRTKANEVKAHLVLRDNELSEHSATARGPLDQRTRDKFTEIHRAECGDGPGVEPILIAMQTPSPASPGAIGHLASRMARPLFTSTRCIPPLVMAASCRGD